MGIVNRSGEALERVGGIAGWLTVKFRGGQKTEPRLALVERIALAPRQSLALIVAEGRKILVATSAEGGPAFYPLDQGIGWSVGGQRNLAGSKRGTPKWRSKFASQRVSW